MQGLSLFISDIRNCRCKEAEIRRINKELGNIRYKFKGDKTLNGYNKKKYLCKLLFIFLLGYDIDIGRMEAINLINSSKYSEKQIGYLFLSVVMTDKKDFMPLLLKSLRHDLCTRNSIHQNLALQYVANMASEDIVEDLGNEVLRLFFCPDTLNYVKQSAALALRSFILVKPDIIPDIEASMSISSCILDQHIGFATSVLGLIEALAKLYPDVYKICVPMAVKRLNRIVSSAYNFLHDYTYYFTAAPWLSVKLLRLLQCFPIPTEINIKSQLLYCLEVIIHKSQEPPKTRKVEHSNAKYSIVFEAIQLSIRVGDFKLIFKACNLLGSLLKHKDSNLRFLSLEAMCQFSKSEVCKDKIKRHLKAILSFLTNETDVSIWQQTEDLLFIVCDKTNVENIVEEMLKFLEKCDLSLRKETVSKIATLAEKFTVDYLWYIDVILKLITSAGECVSDKVWYKFVQIVIEREEVQGYAAKSVFEALEASECQECMIQVAGYILGEFGNLIAGNIKSGPGVQLDLLHSMYPNCCEKTKCILLTTYIKFMNLFPGIKSDVQSILSHDSIIRSHDIEIQQRTVEYLKLSNMASDLLATVLEEMPPYEKGKTSILNIFKSKKTFSETNLSENNDFDIKSQEMASDVSKNEDKAEKKSDDNLEVTNSTMDSQINPVCHKLIDVESDSFQSEPTLSSIELVSNEKACQELIFVENGTLYEDEYLLVYIKSDFERHTGSFHLAYINKTKEEFLNFSTNITHSTLNEKCTILPKPCNPVIPSGGHIEQIIEVECLNEFDEMPVLTLYFMCTGKYQEEKLKIPLALSKFIKPSTMTREVFAYRWKNLGNLQPQVQRIFTAKYPMVIEISKRIFRGFHFSIMEDIDQNPENLVCAGVFHTQSSQAGCLVRLERNCKLNMYRLTVRSIKASVSEKIALLLESML